MNRAFAVVARDEVSLKVAQQLAPRARTALAVDVAFVLPHESRAAQRGTGPLRIGINASGLLAHEAETGRNRFGLSYDYVRYTRQLIEALLARPGVEVHLVPHATSDKDSSDDDRQFIDRLAENYPSVIKVADFADPCDAKSYISGLDFLVAGRMHACIGAYSAGTPVVPVAYSRKFTGLFGMLDYPWVLPVTGHDEASALAFTLTAIDRRDDMARDMARGMMEVRRRLEPYGQMLREVFSAALKGRA
jgi:colanic acid/amylovoran biosynthesis protein